MNAIAETLPDGSTPHDLGPLITTRGHTIFERIVFSLLISVVGAATLGGLGFAAMALATPKPMGGVVGGAFCLAILALCVSGVRRAFRKIDFHHAGAVERSFHKRRSFRYDQVRSLEYVLTRQYVNSIYCGTTLVMRVKTLDGSKFRLDGRHKEKAKGLSLIGLGRKFEGEDEMDVIRDLISAHIAARLTQEMETSGRLDWSGCATLTPEGITPAHGPCKKQLLKWTELGVECKDGTMYFFTPGRKRSVLGIPCASANFFAMTQVMGTLANCEIDELEAQAAA